MNQLSLYNKQSNSYPYIPNWNNNPTYFDLNVKLPGLANLTPIELASEFIKYLLTYDSKTPVLEDIPDKTFSDEPNIYCFDKNINGLGPFNSFEKIAMSGIPDKVLEELNVSEKKKNLNMGLFHEINRVWIISGNKFVLWNYLNDSDYSIIDEIPNDILAVKLVKPKPDMFVNTVKNLLIVATTYNIYLLAISFQDSNFSGLEIYNTDLSVSVNSINVDNFVFYEKANRIFFTGTGDGINVWEMKYCSDDGWFEKRCDKKCLTRTKLSNLLPMNLTLDTSETILSIQVDESRDILYTLSSKSIIRAYTIKSDSLIGPVVVHASLPTKYCGKLMAATSQIVSINVVAKNENNFFYLVAITLGGCRLYYSGVINGGVVSGLSLTKIKYPSSKYTLEEISNMKAQLEIQIHEKHLLGFDKTKSISNVKSHLGYQKESQLLISTNSKSKIVSPGIFIAAVQKQKTDPENNRLFISVPDYGLLNYYHKRVENATFYENIGIIYDIVQLTPSFHATNTPAGYANYFATQYVTSPLHIAILTNKGVQIFKQRTPAEIFISLGENLTPFVQKYGLQEACSTALGIICNDQYPGSVKMTAFNFFVDVTTFNGANNPTYNKPSMLLLNRPETSDYSFQNVKLSARYYGTVLLISRVFREIWSKSVFIVDKKATLPNGKQNEKYLESTKHYLAGINIEKAQVIGFLNTAATLIKFFEEYGNRIPYFTKGRDSNKPLTREDEVTHQAETTVFNALYELVRIIKEAFSFLLILFDESLILGIEGQSFAFKDTIKFIPLDIQKKLSQLTFNDLFVLSKETKETVKEVFTSIINKNISNDISVDYLADSLQKNCSSFCSANDVLVFRAFEHLRKASSVGAADHDDKVQELEKAVKLLKNVGESLSMEELKEAVASMAKLNCFPEIVELILSITNIIDKNNIAMKYVKDGKPLNDERSVIYQKKVERYLLIFDILIQADAKSVELYEQLKKHTPYGVNGNLDSILLESTKVRDESYALCLKCDDVLFHYNFYDWFINHGWQKKLLDFDTPFILPYLKEKSMESAEILLLLSSYYSKRQFYFETAEELYKLAISDFDLVLDQRVEYLAKANVYCNLVEQFNLRQKAVELLNSIQCNLDIASIQMDVVERIKIDNGLLDEQKIENIKELSKKIVNISALYNEFVDPLEYDDLCLVIFKESEYRNIDEINNKWDSFFESLKELSSSTGESLPVLVSNAMIKIGKKVYDSEIVFPVATLFDKLLILLDGTLFSAGTIVEIFIKSGISYNMLYYYIKEMMEAGNGKNKQVLEQEMIYLIKRWWENDTRLKDVISNNEISCLTSYSITNDPINKYTNELGV